MTDILELIDGAISDYMSPDAMRWRPELPPAHADTTLATYQRAFTESYEATGWVVSLPFQEPRYLTPMSFGFARLDGTPIAGRLVHEPAPLGEPVGALGARIHVSDAIPAGHVYLIDPQLFLINPPDRCAGFLGARATLVIFDEIARAFGVPKSLLLSPDLRVRLRRMHTMYGRRLRCRRRRR